MIMNWYGGKEMILGLLVFAVLFGVGFHVFMQLTDGTRRQCIAGVSVWTLCSAAGIVLGQLIN